MSCRISCSVKSFNEIFWFMQQYMKNRIVKSKKLIYVERLNTLKRLPKTSSLVIKSRPACTWPRLSVENINFNTLFQNQHLVCSAGSWYSTQPSVNQPRKHEENAGSPIADTSTPSNGEAKPEEKLTIYQKLKKMYKEYWYVLVPVHLLTSSVWFGSFYYLAASGIDIPALLGTVGAPETWIETLKNSKAGNVVLAYTLYKIATPLRYTVTIGGTTISINYLKKWGWIKPVPNKEQIRKMYEQRKGVFKDFKMSCQDKMQVTKDEFLKTKKEMKLHYIEAKEGLHKSVKETRDGFNEGVQSAADEWKIIGQTLWKNIKGANSSCGSKK